MQLSEALAIHLQTTYIHLEGRSMCFILFRLYSLNPNQIKLPFTRIPDMYSHLTRQREPAHVCCLQGSRNDFPFQRMGPPSLLSWCRLRAAASHARAPSLTSPHSRLCLLPFLQPLPCTASCQCVAALGSDGWGLWCWKTKGPSGTHSI